MVLDGPDLDTGSGGGGVSITSTSDDDDDEVLDLGQQSSGGSTNFDLGRNAGAVVDTGDEIADAGGPDAVLAGTQEQVTKVDKAVSKATDTLKKAASGGSDDTASTTDLPSQAETAAKNAASAVSQSEGLPSVPLGDLGKKALAGVLAAFALVLAVLFGGGS
jgi:hypothetical protein